MKKEKIVEFIDMINSKYKQKDKKMIPGKVGLCAELELYLFVNDLNGKNGKRWYYSAEEAIERN